MLLNAFACVSVCVRICVFISKPPFPKCLASELMTEKHVFLAMLTDKGHLVWLEGT